MRRGLRLRSGGPGVICKLDTEEAYSHKNRKHPLVHFGEDGVLEDMVLLGAI